MNLNNFNQNPEQNRLIDQENKEEKKSIEYPASSVLETESLTQSQEEKKEVPTQVKAEVNPHDVLPTSEINHEVKDKAELGPDNLMDKGLNLNENLVSVADANRFTQEVRFKQEEAERA